MSSGQHKQLRVAMVQPFLAHYRLPIYNLLCRQTDFECVFFADTVNNYNSVKVIDPAVATIPVEQGGLRWVKTRSFWFFKNILWQTGLLRLAFSKDFDVIVYSGSVYFLCVWVSAFLARLTGKRVLMWTHGFLRDEKWLKGWIRALFYRLADGLLLYHQRAKDILIGKGFKADNLFVIYNSLDYDRQVQIRQSLTEQQIDECRQKLFKHPELPILLFIGRLTKQKKLPMLLEAAKRLHQEGLPCNILFVGEGSQKELLQRRTEQLGLKEYVCFYGPSYDERQNGLLIRASDICVSPGEVGLTCMHSLTYGTPVITHNDFDYQMPEYEAIQPGYNGDFFQKNNPAHLAEVIRKWLGNPLDRKTIAARCYEIIDRCYNPHYQIQVFQQAIKQIASAKNFNEHYDLVIVTDLPSFYKINLYNRIAQKKKLLVISVKGVSGIRNEDFYKGERQFAHLVISHRFRLKKLWELITTIKSLNYGKIIISGWECLECWLAAFLSPREKNAVVVESSVFESKTKGIYGWLKRIYLSRISQVFASGEKQKKLVEKLGFKGEINITKGVGIFNIVPQPPYKPVAKVERFIYVGRLAPEKNLTYLIETFNQLPELKLSIIGYGALEQKLKRIAAANIAFLGAVPNRELPAYYQQHHVFILPSLSEPWGLVVEEALNNGLPVIVSNKVGCIGEVVKDGENGLVFDVGEKDGLLKVIRRMTDVAFYNKLSENISKLNFGQIADYQVQQYLE